jgi:putative MATE family efflux protein
MTDRKQELAHKPIGPLLRKYAAPPMVALFVHALYNVMDSIFVGQGPGTLALAGLAICFPIQMAIMAAGMGMGVGTASVVSRALGAKDQRLAERAAGTSFTVTAVIALLVNALGLMFLEPLLELFGATESVLPYAKDYLSVILFGSFFLTIAVSSSNVARAEGNVRIAMVFMIVGAVVNLILDPIFIFGLDMGIRGAAIATVIANMCSFTLYCTYFIRGNSMLKITRCDLIPDFSVLPEVLRIGGVSFMSMVAGNLMAIPINGAIGMYGQDVHFAIMGVINRSMMFFFMPIYGLVQGLQPIIGFNYGARDYARVIKAVRKAALYASVLSALAFLVLMLAAEWVLGVFSSDAELIDEGASIMRIVILVMPFVGVQMVGGSLFLALGKTQPAFILTLSRQVILLLPMVLIMPRIFGLEGLWAAFPIADTVAFLMTATWVRFEMRALGRRSQMTDQLTEESAG